MAHQDRFDILLGKRLSGVAKQGYTMLYGKSQIIPKLKGRKMFLKTLNRKRQFTLILVIAIISVNTALALPGSGTQEYPWRIESLVDFNNFAADANYWDDYTRLETDVNLAGRTYTTAVIAPDTSSSFGFQGTSFKGVFDGNGCKITALMIDDGGAGNDCLGLFGFISGGQIRNLGLEGGSVKGGSVSGTGYGIGGLVGKISGGSVSNCYSTADVSGDNDTGGLVGRNNRSSVSNCYSTGDVSGRQEVGGLVGNNWGDSANSANVSNCYSTGDVSGTMSDIGGVVGLNGGNSANVSNCYSTGDVSGIMSSVGGVVGAGYAHGSISNCYSTGDLSGDYWVGGVVGWNKGIVSNCYSTGSVSGDVVVGGLVGKFSGGSVSNCYSICDVNGTGDYFGGLVGANYGSASYTSCFWDSDINPNVNGIGNGSDPNVIGKTTAEMKKESTFVGWDFVGETANGTEDIWKMCYDPDYPHLFWEQCPRPSLEMPMHFTPRMLNPKSKGKWIKAHFILPEGFSVEDVNTNSPAKIVEPFMADSNYMDVFLNKDGLVEIMAAFDRADFCSNGSMLEDIVVIGRLTTGQYFYGTDTIRIKTNNLEYLAVLTSYWLEAGCGEPDWCEGADLNRDSVVDFIDFAFFDGCCLEFIKN